MARILIVDDEPKIRRSIVRHLKTEKHEVLEAENGKIAIELVKKSSPDLIVLDVMMPEMDGIEFCKWIRNDAALSNVYIIMLSARARSEDKVFGLDIGADDYLAKPFDPKELLARIRTGIRTHEVIKSANIDALTGLYNKGFFNSSIRQEIARYNRKQEVFSLALADIDFFKKVNDTHGHAAGDEVLVMLADIFRGIVRKTDICSRWGGEEFATILTGTSEEGAAILGEKMRATVEASLFPKAGSITISIGIAAYRGDEDIFFQRADAALYKAKQNGRNRVEIG
ncbi:diguanylate cyclase [bacterium]|nr:diguanylate cyclase [bacterium]